MEMEAEILFYTMGRIYTLPWASPAPPWLLFIKIDGSPQTWKLLARTISIGAQSTQLKHGIPPLSSQFFQKMDPGGQSDWCRMVPLLWFLRDTVKFTEFLGIFRQPWAGPIPCWKFLLLSLLVR